MRRGWHFELCLSLTTKQIIRKILPAIRRRLQRLSSTGNDCGCPVAISPLLSALTSQCATEHNAAVRTLHNSKITLEWRSCYCDCICTFVDMQT